MIMPEVPLLHCFHGTGNRRCRVREVLHNSQVYTIKRTKANWTGHILRRNCLLKLVIAGKTEGRRRRGRRLKQLLDDVKEKRIFGNLKEEES